MRQRSDKPRYNLDLGHYIRRRREANGWTLDDAEARSGVDRSYWSRIEIGEFQRPDPRSLADIAVALRVPLEDLYALAGYAAPKRLPNFRPYLRSKYRLPPEAIEQLESYFTFLRHQYGIPADQPVFPPKPKRRTSQKPRSDRRAA